MNFKQFLTEEYYNTYTISGKTVEIFRNPPPSEPKTNAKEIRGIIDGKGDLFIWSSETPEEDVIHELVMRKMNKSSENGAISVFIYPKKKMVDISFWDYKQSDLTQQEVNRLKKIVETNPNLAKYLRGKFKMRTSNTLYE